MKTLGNIIWIIFGGLHTALEYFIAGLVLMITIIGIPFGLQSMKLGMLAIWPFGTKVKWKPYRSERCISDGQSWPCHLSVKSSYNLI